MNNSKYFILLLLVLIILGGFVYWQITGKNTSGRQQQDQQSQSPLNNEIVEEQIAETVLDNLILDGQYEVSGEDVNYYSDTVGYYAYPDQEGTYPGVVMIHEWWGLNDNVKQMADKLASQGYHVLAVDLYNGQIADTPEEAQDLTASVSNEEAVNNMQGAVAFLKDQGANKIAALGWCFGGGQSLKLTLSGQPLDATVIYYGTLETDQTKLSLIKWPVLGIFGDQDQSIPVSSVNRFKTALDNLRVENEIYVYPGVGHAFANPTGMNFSQEETKDAWTKTLNFLNKHLKNS